MPYKKYDHTKNAKLYDNVTQLQRNVSRITTVENSTNDTPSRQFECGISDSGKSEKTEIYEYILKLAKLRACEKQKTLG